MATQYTFSISANFPNHIVDTARLTHEIQTSAIVTSLNRIDTSGDSCNVWFNATLSGGDQTILNAIVAAHTGAPFPSAPLPVAINFSDTTVSAGYVSTTQTVFREVMGSTYNEQTSNAQRSVVSDNVNDTLVGTGARSIRITYYDQTLAGPYTEDINLNGLTIVNTVNTNICFIEKIEVMTVGSSLGNLGNITLFAAIAGGGSTVGVVSSGDNSTFWSHHYVASNKIARITGVYGNSASTVPAAGGFMHVRVTRPATANSPVKTVAPVSRLSLGQQVPLSFTSPISVYGPARVTILVKPDTTDLTSWLTGLNYYEDAQNAS